MKNLEVNIDKLMSNNLDISSYFFLYYLYNKDKDTILKYIKQCGKISTKSFDNMKDLGFINKSGDGDYTFDNITLTDKFEKVFLSKEDNPENWIDQWYDLFPKGIKSGGFAIRCDKNDCLKRLIKFRKNYPQYTKGIIIAATKKYLDRMKKNNYAYCKLAPYYVYKDGLSMLSGDCEEVLNNLNTKDDFKGFIDDI